MRRLGIFLLFSLWCLGAQAQEGPGELLDYGRHLYEQGEYFRAIGEFKRLGFRYPESPEASQAELLIARAYLAGGQPGEAAGFLGRKLEENPEADVYWILYGLARLDQGRHEPFGLRAEQVEEAVAAFERVDPEHPQAPYVRDFAADWRALPAARPHSPTVAGGLSAVVPGAGSLYLGRWREGAYAFLLTGLFALASKEAYHGGQPALGAVLGGFGLAFYGGNVYLAVNSAHKQNDWARAQDLQRLRQKHGLFFIPPGAGAPSRF